MFRKSDSLTLVGSSLSSGFERCQSTALPRLSVVLHDGSSEALGADLGPASAGAIHSLLKEAIQLKPFRQLPTQPTSAELASALQANSIDQHACHLLVVRRRLDICREQLQLLCFSLRVEHLDGAQKTSFRQTIQLSQITEGPLPRSARPCARFPPATNRCVACRLCYARGGRF